MLTHSKPPPAYHSYDPITGEYRGSGVCDLSPARYPRGHEMQGHLVEPDVPILPGCATFIEPPETGPNQAAVWQGDAWALVADHRGEIRYDDETHDFVVVTSLGEPKQKPIEVHDAQYVLDAESDVARPRIRMWVNGDVIDFADDPASVPRRVLAAWEAKGETIRPVDLDMLPEPVDPKLLPPTPDAEHQAKLDAYVRKVVEGVDEHEER